MERTVEKTATIQVGNYGGLYVRTQGEGYPTEREYSPALVGFLRADGYEIRTGEGVRLCPQCGVTVIGDEDAECWACKAEQAEHYEERGLFVPVQRGVLVEEIEIPF